MSLEEIPAPRRRNTPLFATSTVSWPDGTHTARTVNLADDDAFASLRRVTMAAASRGGITTIEPTEMPMKYVVKHRGFEIEVTKEGPLQYTSWVLGEKCGEGQTVSEAEKIARAAIDGMGEES